MNGSLLEQTATRKFHAEHGESPAFLARAPGRVELLGNHTDYNGGLVLAAAIDRFTVVVGSPKVGRIARIRSLSLDQESTFNLDTITPGSPGSWERYVQGVVWAIQTAYGPLTSGFEAVLAGNIPLGGGLSSSASLQASIGLFLLQAGLVPETNANLDQNAFMRLAQVLQRSENDFVGVASGLLDQFTVLFGRAEQALTLDCRSLAFARLPLGNPAPAIVVCDSKTSRKLADGMYNRRRSECETVVSYFQEKRGPEQIRQLRDVSLSDLESDWNALDPVGRLRARHVLNENARVEQGAEALRLGDVPAFGRLMTASHASSRDDFSNSSPALDALIEAAEASPGFLGGKLSGAGWAGCTVNLVTAECASAFAASVSERYERATGTIPEIHICHASEATSRVLD